MHAHRHCRRTPIYAAVLTVASSSALGHTPDVVYANPEPAAYDNYGSSVATDGVLTIATSPFDEVEGVGSGSATVYDAASGAALWTLAPPDRTEDQQFGTSCALNDDYIVVGAGWDSETALRAGAVYVFNRHDGTFLRKVTKDPSDAQEFDRFGTGVALNDGFLLVSADGDDENGADSGALFLYELDTWTLVHKMMTADGAPLSGRPIALDGPRALAHAYRFPKDEFPYAGSVRVFSIASGQETQTLRAKDAIDGDGFGYSLACQDGIAWIGAYTSSAGIEGGGAVYVMDAISGAEITCLTASDASTEASFGSALALDGGRAVVGAYEDGEAGANAGALYVFDAIRKVELGKILPPVIDAGQLLGVRFGLSAAVHGDRLVAGFAGSSDPFVGSRVGAAYGFDLRGFLSVDLDGNGRVGSSDLAIMLAAWGGLAGDLDGDGVTGASDLAVLLAAWE